MIDDYPGNWIGGRFKLVDQTKINIWTRRQQQVARRLYERGHELFYFTNPVSIYYLTGVNLSSGALFYFQNKFLLAVDGRYAQSSKLSGNCEVEIFGPGCQFETPVEILKKLEFSVAGIEASHFSLADYLELKQNLEGRTILPEFRLVEQLRQIKSADEIAEISNAVKIADQVFSQIVPRIKFGMTEIEIAAEINYLINLSGCRPAFNIIVASGCNSALPHASPGEAEIVAGTMLKMDFGCCCQGYNSDITRTIYLGKPDSQFSDIYQAVLEAQQLAVKSVKAGMRCRELDQIARECLARHGLDQYFIHNLGHCLGLEIHENPRIGPMFDDLIVPGMVFTVEPGVYLPGWGGVRIEDVIWLSEQGPVDLTASSHEIIVRS